ncbi:MAG TPA: DoxX family protein [Solirubrobacteraceae bacterium]|nr:DoxX family protein [Solirubrobacteraceae bacterium]
MSAQHSITRPQHSEPAREAVVPPARRALALARSNCRAKDLFRIAFGAIWVIDAAFKWQPAFQTGFADTLKRAAQGQPGWLHGWFQFWINLVTPNASFFAYSTAVIETMVAVALIVGFARKLTYIGAALFSVMIWATAEGFGGPYTAGSTDIGAAVIYAVVFMGLLALNYEGGPSRFSVPSSSNACPGGTASPRSVTRARRASSYIARQSRSLPTGYFRTARSRAGAVGSDRTRDRHYRAPRRRSHCHRGAHADCRNALALSLPCFRRRVRLARGPRASGRTPPSFQTCVETRHRASASTQSKGSGARSRTLAPDEDHARGLEAAPRSLAPADAEAPTSSTTCLAGRPRRARSTGSRRRSLCCAGRLLHEACVVAR